MMKMLRSQMCWMSVLMLLVAGTVPLNVAFAQQSSNYPPMLLPVPWLCQVPPGDWNNTKNCGQTCSAMLGGYFKGFTPASSAITNENKWLATRFKDSRYTTSANGYYTHFNDGRNSLGVLLKEYYGLNSTVRNGSNITDVLKELNAGRPVIVGVKISGGKVVSSGGVAHWALAVGWNARDGKIILNDPGTNSGRQIQYSVSAFDASWVTQGRIYAPISR